MWKLPDMLSAGQIPSTAAQSSIFTTERGERMIERGREIIAEIEAEWEKRLGKRRLAELKTSLRRILDFEKDDNGSRP